MKTLKELLLAEGKRPALLDDCTRLIDEEVDSKTGLSGIGIKMCFKTVKMLKPGMIRESVDYLLDDFVEKMETFYAEYEGGNPKAAGGIEEFVVSKAGSISETLLGITDARAARSKNKVIKGAYDKLRPEGKRQVETAMPRIGRLLAKHGA